MNNKQLELPSNKKFGYFFTIVFLLAGLYLIRFASVYYDIILIIFSFLFFIITLINADILLPLNKLWMKFAFLL